MKPLAPLALAAAVLLAGCGQRIPMPKAQEQGTAQAPAVAVMAGAPQMRDGVDDTSIVAQIKRALVADDELGQFVIDVDSKEGFVVLSGVAPSEAARERATTIARGTPHVNDIANQLSVRQG